MKNGEKDWKIARDIARARVRTINGSLFSLNLKKLKTFAVLSGESCFTTTIKLMRMVEIPKLVGLEMTEEGEIPKTTANDLKSTQTKLVLRVTINK